MAQEIDIWVATFNMISFWAGILSLYFWVSIYTKAKRGSIAWLLFAITSVFMVSASLYPYLLIYFTELAQDVQYTISLNFLIFWGMVYTVFFASAGYALKRDLIVGPKEQAGTYLIDRLYTPLKIIPEEDTSSTTTDTEMERFARIIKGKSLLEFNSGQRYEDAVLEMVLRFWGDLRNTVIISTSPRAGYYNEKLMELVDVGAIKIINLSFTKKELQMEDGYLTIPIDDISNITSVLKELPQECSIIMDATTMLLQNLPGAESSKILGEIISKSGERDLIILANENIHSKIPDNIINSLNKKGKLNDNSIEIEVEKEFQSIALVMGERFYLGA